MRNLQEALVKLVVRHRKAKSTNRTSLDLKFQSKSLLPLTIKTRSGPTKKFIHQQGAPPVHGLHFKYQRTRSVG